MTTVTAASSDSPDRLTRHKATFSSALLVVFARSLKNFSNRTFVIALTVFKPKLQYTHGIVNIPAGLSRFERPVIVDAQKPR
jgi:hypothetical protein